MRDGGVVKQSEPGLSADELLKAKEEELERERKRKTGLDGVYVSSGRDEAELQWEKKDLMEVLEQLRRMK